MNGTSKIQFTNRSFLVDRNTVDFCMFTLYCVTLLNSLVPEYLQIPWDFLSRNHDINEWGQFYLLLPNLYVFYLIVLAFCNGQDPQHDVELEW